MQIQSTYLRIAPNGTTTTVTPTNQNQVEYYRSLEEHGYRYKKQLTIHNNLQECESCSA